MAARARHATAAVTSAAPATPRQTRWLPSLARAWRIVPIALVVLVALLGPALAPQNPYDLAGLFIQDGRLPPMTEGSTGIVHMLGTDQQGRDVLSAILYGMRISLVVGISGTAIALTIGIVTGILAAYYRGTVDTVMMRLVDLQLSVPPLLVALALVAALGPGLDKIIVALVVSQWAIYSRVIRGSALPEVRKGYIEAAQCLKLGVIRIAFVHLLMNCRVTLAVIIIIQTAQAIILESSLSFLGIGLPPTRPSLGLLVANGLDVIYSGRYWISVFPAIALFLIILSFNIFGEYLRQRRGKGETP